MRCTWLPRDGVSRQPVGRTIKRGSRLLEAAGKQGATHCLPGAPAWMSPCVLVYLCLLLPTERSWRSAPAGARLLLSWSIYVCSCQQSEHRTLDPEEADFFYVPVYTSCWMHPVYGWADHPWWYGVAGVHLSICFSTRGTALQAPADLVFNRSDVFLHSSIYLTVSP
jgi:hypothetical protein